MSSTTQMQNPYHPSANDGDLDRAERLVTRSWFFVILVSNFAIIGSANGIATFWGAMGFRWHAFRFRFTMASLLAICVASTMAGLVACATQDRTVRLPLNSLNYGFVLPLSLPLLTSLISHFVYRNVASEIHSNLPPVALLVQAGVLLQIFFVSRVTRRMRSPRLPLLIAAGSCYAFGLAPAWLHLSQL